MRCAAFIVAILGPEWSNQLYIADGAALMRASVVSEYGAPLMGTDANAAAAVVAWLPEGAARWTIQVLPSRSHANAFAFPDGVILITRGLLDECGSEDELAFVIAHEVAHVLLGHAARSARAALARLACYALLGGCAVERGQSIAAEEAEADRLATALMDRAGYDPLAAANLLTRLATVGRGKAVCVRPMEW